MKIKNKDGHELKMVKANRGFELTNMSDHARCLKVNLRLLTYAAMNGRVQEYRYGRYYALENTINVVIDGFAGHLDLDENPVDKDNPVYELMNQSVKDRKPQQDKPQQFFGIDVECMLSHPNMWQFISDSNFPKIKYMGKWFYADEDDRVAVEQKYGIDIDEAIRNYMNDGNPNPPRQEEEEDGGTGFIDRVKNLFTR